MIRFLFAIIFLFLLENTVCAQQKFFRVYSEHNDDRAEGIVQLPDSSYTLCGSSSSFSGEGSQAFIVNIDSIGNVRWSASFGGNESEQARRLVHVTGFGYFVAGMTNSIGEGAFDGYVAALDETGVLQWESTVGGVGWDRIYDASRTSQDDIIVVGEQGGSNDQADVMLARVDQSGNVLWEYQDPQPGNDWLETITSFQDSLFFAFGSVYVSDSLNHKVLVVHGHEDGTIYWKDTLGVAGDHWVHDVMVDSNDEVVAVGEVSGISHLEEDYLYIRMETSGNVLALNTGHAAGTQQYQVVTDFGLSGKRYLGWNYLDQWSAGTGNAAAISRHDSLMGWENTGVVVNFEEPDEINEIIPTADGGAIAVGVTKDQFVGPSRFFVAKIGPNDDYPQEWTSTPFVIDGFLDLPEPDFAQLNSVYPVPTNEKLFVEIKGDFTYEVSTLAGTHLAAGHALDLAQIDASDLASGVYLLTVSSGKNRSTSRFYVQH